MICRHVHKIMHIFQGKIKKIYIAHKLITIKKVHG